MQMKFIKKSEFFFSKKPRFFIKIFSFQENLHFDKLERVWDLFFDLSFPSYGRFIKKNQADTPKVFPHPTVGALSASWML